MKTAFIAFTFLLLCSCSGVNEEIKEPLETLETSFVSASALGEMKELMLKAQYNAKSWLTEKGESVDKTMFKNFIKGRPYPGMKEKLGALSKAWPVARKEKLKIAFDLCDTLLIHYESMTNTLNTFEDYENPARVLETRALYEDENIDRKNQEIFEILNELQNQFEMESQSAILKIKYSVNK